MAVTTNLRIAADEEARAEVDVLTSRLEKTTQLTKKIQASLNRLETSGRSVQEAIGPIYGNTQRLQVIGRNIDSIVGAIEKVRKPSDIKNNEEETIRAGPDKAGLSSFLASLKRINKALAELKATNIKSNQQSAADLTRLYKTGTQQLEATFQRILQEDARPVEPLFFITKEKPFPSLTQDKSTRLGLINSFLASGSTSLPGSLPSTAEIYSNIRGAYILASLSNLAAASVNTAKKKTPDALYRQGTNGIGTFAKGIEGAYLAEYDSICALFTRDEWGRVFTMTCQASMKELVKTLKELNQHIRANLTTDCFLAYEIIEIISNLSATIDNRTGELKQQFATALKPIRDTGRSSFAELLEDTRRRTTNLSTLPYDGASIPLTTEIMTRLKSMVDFLRPVSSIMISLGDGNWRTVASPSSVADAIPSLKSFDVTADGRQLFANYGTETIETYLSTLEQKSRILIKAKASQGVFMLNNLAIIDRVTRNSDLQPLLAARLSTIAWRKKAPNLYMDGWIDPCKQLMDQQFTNRAGQRPPSGSAISIDSAAIVRGLNSKEKEAVKERFRLFNTSFDDLVAKHKSYNMEKEVREMLAKDVQVQIEPLYGRFWDRYHEIEKGKGRIVKYDKPSMSTVLLSLGNAN